MYPSKHLPTASYEVLKKRNYVHFILPSLATFLPILCSLIACAFRRLKINIYIDVNTVKFPNSLLTCYAGTFGI